MLVLERRAELCPPGMQPRLDRPLRDTQDLRDFDDRTPLEIEQGQHRTMVGIEPTEGGFEDDSVGRPFDGVRWDRHQDRLDAPRPAEGVSRRVDHDSSRPRLEGTILTQLRQSLPDEQEAVLQHVSGQVAIENNRAREAGQRVDEWRNEGVERFSVSRPCPRNQLGQGPNGANPPYLQDTGYGTRVQSASDRSWWVCPTTPESG